jgi:hypothetical protein
MKNEPIKLSNKASETLNALRKRMAQATKSKKPYTRKAALEKLIDMQGGLK